MKGKSISGSKNFLLLLHGQKKCLTKAREHLRTYLHDSAPIAIRQFTGCTRTVNVESLPSWSSLSGVVWLMNL